VKVLAKAPASSAGVPGPWIDWSKFRAVVAKEVHQALKQERKVVNDEQRRAAEATLMEAARQLAHAEPRELAATYSSAIVTLRNQVRGIWESELKEFKQNVAKLSWDARDATPCFDQVLSQCGVHRSLTVLAVSLTLSAALGPLPERTALLEFKQDYIQLCDELIRPLRWKAQLLEREIDLHAAEHYHALKTGYQHDADKQFFADRKMTLAAELARVEAKICTHLHWFAPLEEGRTGSGEIALLSLAIPGPVYTVTH
jgi:hypothetical protein